MAQNGKRTRQTVRFLQWIRKYSGWWYLICTPGEEHMNPRMMKMLIERLAKESFYEIIFVLLMVHRNEEFMKQFSDYMLLDTLTDRWEQDQDRILRNITEYLE